MICSSLYRLLFIGSSLSSLLGTLSFYLAQFSGSRAEELSKRMGHCYLLPPVPFGNSREHMGFRGTITLRPTTLAMILEDIADSLHHHGFRTVVVFSSHGGNWIIKPALRELNFKYSVFGQGLV